MNGTNMSAGSGSQGPAEAVDPLGLPFRQKSCERCGARLNTLDDRVRLCLNCAREDEDPLVIDPWELRQAEDEAMEGLDPSDLFRMAQQACELGLRKADFRECVEVLCKVSQILAARIRRLDLKELKEWIESQPGLLENRPALRLALAKASSLEDDGHG